MDAGALNLLQRFLALDPNKRITAKDALSHYYFATEPFPCKPEELPHVCEDTHEYQVKLLKASKRMQQEVRAYKMCNSSLSNYMDATEFKAALQGKRFLPQQNSTTLDTKMMEPDTKISQCKLNYNDGW